MTYHVDVTERAARDLGRIYANINAEDGAQARAWFNRLEQAILSLDAHPARGAPIPEGGGLRQLLYGRRGRRYRIIYTINERDRVVSVLHIRHGSRTAFRVDDPDDKE